MNDPSGEDAGALKYHVRKLLADVAPLSSARAVLDQKEPTAEKAWKALGEGGWLGAAISEKYGGLGLGPNLLCAIAEECGRVTASIPIVSSIYLVSEALLLFGSEDQKQHYGPRLARGELVATLALYERAGPLSPGQIGARFEAGRLSGKKIAVPDAQLSELFVVAAVNEGGGIALYLVEFDPETVIVAPVQSMDPTSPLAEVTFRQASAQPLGDVNGWRAIEEILSRGAIYVAFDQIGAAETCLMQAVDYSKGRYAFNRPIGSYQAVKHRLADVYVEVQLARAHADAAAGALAAGAGDLVPFAAAARISASRALEVAARDMIQTFSGIAISWEHDANLFYRRALQRELALGSAREWVARMLPYADTHGEGAVAQIDEGEEKDRPNFRDDARRWLETNAPRFTPEPGCDTYALARIIRRWLAAKSDAGYVGFTTPAEYGGRGTGWTEKIIFEQEESKFPIGQLKVSYGRGNFISMIQAHGSSEQKERFIQPTLRGDIFWCQMFSEPGAGSDVAALRTRAVRVEGGWIVNGQKTWITGAHVADMGMLAVRTDPNVPKHRGLSFVLVDMHAPGVEIRPLKQISGHSHFSEVFFTDVFVPDENVVEGPGQGWNVIMTTLLAERPNAISSGGSAFGGEVLKEAIRVACCVPGNSGPSALVESDVADKVVRYCLAIRGIERIVQNMTIALAQGGVPGPEGAISKFVWTRATQEIARFALELLGPVGLVTGQDDPDIGLLQETYFTSAGFRQAGGTDDISKSVIAERVLGMPADPRFDKDLAFNALPVGI